MNRERLRRAAALAWLALLALGVLACDAEVGVGVAVPVHGGWGPRPEAGYAINGVYVGGPSWP